MSTTSHYWSATQVTDMIRRSQDDPQAFEKLVTLVYRPLFKQLKAFLDHDGLSHSYMAGAEQVFADYLIDDIQTTLKTVDFQDRKHFLNLILLRCKQKAGTQVKRERIHKRKLLDRSPQDNPATHNGDVSGLDRLIHQEAITCFWQTLADAPAEQQDVLYRLFVEGYSLRKVASENGRSFTFVQKCQNQFVNQLREKLSD